MRAQKPFPESICILFDVIFPHNICFLFNIYFQVAAVVIIVVVLFLCEVLEMRDFLFIFVFK